MWRNLYTGAHFARVHLITNPREATQRESTEFFFLLFWYFKAIEFCGHRLSGLDDLIVAQGSRPHGFTGHRYFGNCTRFFFGLIKGFLWAKKVEIIYMDVIYNPKRSREWTQRKGRVSFPWTHFCVWFSLFLVCGLIVGRKFHTSTCSAHNIDGLQTLQRGRVNQGLSINGSHPQVGPTVRVRRGSGVHLYKFIF